MLRKNVVTLLDGMLRMDVSRASGVIMSDCNTVYIKVLPIRDFKPHKCLKKYCTEESTCII